MVRRCDGCDGYRKINLGGMMHPCPVCNGAGVIEEKKEKKQEKKEKRHEGD